MRVWKSNNPRQPMRFGTSGEVVAAFLGLHAWWFNTEGNQLKGRQDDCRVALIKLLEDPAASAMALGEDSSVDYVIDKFLEDYRHDFVEVV